MTEKEKRDLNRRVALEMGYKFYEIQWPKRDLQWSGHHFQIQNSPPEGTEWHREVPLSAVTPSYSGSVPNYCTDPAAADLVRQEIERRGWSVMIHCEPGRYSADIAGHPKVEGYAESTESPHHALCLAFMAACEEREEGK